MGGAPRLIALPSDYNALFEMAAESKCARTQKLPAKSGLCLLCGQVLCIGCCRGAVVAHCRGCNDGIGAILFFQKSSVLLVWDGYCTEYPSLYLDRNGEPDTNLWRGVRLKCDAQRYRALTQLVVQHGVPNKMTQLRKSERQRLETRLELW